MKKILFLHQGESVETYAIGNLHKEFGRLAPGGFRVESVDPVSASEDSAFSWRLFSGNSRRRDALRDLLREMAPDVVVATCPLFPQLIAEIYREGRIRDFKLIALSLDFVPPKEWTPVIADHFVVMHEEASRFLEASGMARETISVCGFPVRFPEKGSARTLTDPEQRRVLYLVNGARRKAPKLIHRLLENKEWNLTVRVEEGESQIEEMARTREASVSGRMRVVNSSTPIPELLSTHDLVISRPIAEILHESVAAGCPLVAFPIRTDAEQQNVSFLVHSGAVGKAERPREVLDQIELAFQEDGELLSRWRKNLLSLKSSPGPIRLAPLLLEMAENSVSIPPLFRALPPPVEKRSRRSRGRKQLLLCDLHTHTTWSDGKLTIPELVDFYGSRKFDCLCITDHLCDPDRLLGRIVNLTGLVIPPDEIGAYFAEIEREKKRAWNQYELLLMAGIEFNKDGYTAKSSAHLLGVDLHEPIDPRLDLKQLIAAIQAQGGLAIASHPHEIKSEWGKNTLYLWEHLDEFESLIDVWEVANRDDIFNPVGLKRLPFMGNSDFHKPKHIQSWKTLLHCEKEPEAIKHCLRANRDVSLTLYRDHRFGLETQDPALNHHVA